MAIKSLLIGTAAKPIRVLCPPTPPAAPTRVVVYVHGYNIDQPGGSTKQSYVEYISTAHHLVEQFRPKVEAGSLVIIPSSPEDPDDPVRWTSLRGLLDYVSDKIPSVGIFPTTPITVMGHSGAYRTLKHWLSDPQVDHVALIDGLYAYRDEFLAWVEMDHSSGLQVKLSLVASHRGPPRVNADALVARAHIEHVVKEESDPMQTLDVAELMAPLFYWRSDLSHMDLIKTGTIIPELLRRNP